MTKRQKLSLLPDEDRHIWLNAFLLRYEKILYLVVFIWFYINQHLLALFLLYLACTY